MPTPAEVLQEVRRQAKNVKGIQQRLANEINRLFANTAKDLQLLLRDPKAFPPAQLYDLNVAAKIVAQLDTILKDSGLDDIVNSYRDEFPKIAKDGLKYFEKLDIDTSLVGIDETTLNAYIRYSETNLRRTVDKTLTAPLQQAVFQGAFGGLDMSHAVEQVVERTQYLSPAQAEVEIGDKMLQFQRAVTVEKAESVGLQIYQYLGPDDEITSDQCKFLLDINKHGVPGMLYKDEISAKLHKALRENPLIAGGHPRCRHKYYPVSEDYAVELGFKPRKA